MDADGEPDEDGIGADLQDNGKLHTANGTVAATDASAAAGPSHTMDVIEGEWDGLLEESRGTGTVARVPPAVPAAAEPAQASQPTEAETAALNKRQRRQEKKRLAEEREAAIRKAVCVRDLTKSPALQLVIATSLAVRPSCSEPVGFMWLPQHEVGS